MALKSQVLQRLPQGTVGRLRKLRDRVVAWRYSRDLIRLGELFGSDKWGNHWYLQHYRTHFESLRKKRINLLEIGVGGYADPSQGGNSLRTWKAYFPHANIFGIDIYDKRKLEEKRIKIFQGSQIDEVFLRDVVDRIGGVDIVIDDGSHLNTHVVQTFGILFPLLRNPGIYVVEDTQTSYWPGFGGSSRDLNAPSTIMGHFTSLAHCLNHEEILRDERSPSEFDRHIVAMHFYHNLIFIFKGDNSEGSNVLRHDGSDSQIVYEGISYESAGNEQPCSEASKHRG
jgi:hypothetical protein